MKSSLMLMFAFVVMALIVLLSSSCEDGPKIKVYSSAPERGGLLREQSQELILYQDSAHYLCTSPDDFRTLMEWCQLTRK